MSESIIITVPLPPNQTNPNGRAGWRAKAKATKMQREAAFIAALDALVKAKHLAQRPRWKAVEVHANYFRPGGRVAMDQDNLIAWLKASVDGLADAGLLDNDRGVTWLPPSQIWGPEAGVHAKVVLTITHKQ